MNQMNKSATGAGLSGLSRLSGLFGLSCWPDRKTNQRNQRDQTDQRNQMNQRDELADGYRANISARSARTRVVVVWFSRPSRLTNRDLSTVRSWSSTTCPLFP